MGGTTPTHRQCLPLLADGKRRHSFASGSVRWDFVTTVGAKISRPMGSSAIDKCHGYPLPPCPWSTLKLYI